MRILPTPVRSILSAVAALVAVALIGAWGTGRVLTDRYEWSQWVYWVPPVLTVGGAVVFLVVSRILLHLGARKRGLGPLLRGIGYVGVVVVVMWTGLVEWGYGSWPRRWLSAAAVGKGARVVAWNMASNSCPGGTKTLKGLAPDLVVASNPSQDIQWDEVKAGMGPGATVTRAGMFAVASRWPVVRYGWVGLGLEGRIFQFDATDLTPGLKEHVDSGAAAFVEIDATEGFGRKLVVWCVDLPSDPFLERVEVMKKARAAIAAWAGPERRIVDGAKAKGMPETVGFPAPDLIVGDFNTPRGSGSLAELTGDLKSAFSQAGMGMDGTWPRKWPAFHIDQMFVGAGLRATRYEIVDPGESTHRLQVGEIVKAE